MTAVQLRRLKARRERKARLCDHLTAAAEAAKAERWPDGRHFLRLADDDLLQIERILREAAE